MKWYRDMLSTVPKPRNTRQNPTVKRSVPVELVLTKTKTTKELPAPTLKRRRQNDDDIQPTKNDNQLHPKPAEPEQQAESPAAVVVVNPPNAATKTILSQSWWDTRDAI
jgi:hypothetical protein